MGKLSSGWKLTLGGLLFLGFALVAYMLPTKDVVGVDGGGLVYQQTRHIYIWPIMVGVLAIVAGGYQLIVGDQRADDAVASIRHCPACKQVVTKTATSCRHCGVDLATSATQPPLTDTVTSKVSGGTAEVTSNDNTASDIIPWPASEKELSGDGVASEASLDWIIGSLVIAAQQLDAPLNDRQIAWLSFDARSGERSPRSPGISVLTLVAEEALSEALDAGTRSVLYPSGVRVPVEWRRHVEGVAEQGTYPNLVKVLRLVTHGSAKLTGGTK